MVQLNKLQTVTATVPVVVMAGAVKVLLAVVVLGVAVSLAADPKMDLTPDSLLWSALLFSRDAPSARADLGVLGRRRGFSPLLDTDPAELSAYYGYPAEHHYVTTQDGYVLGIHRIPGPRGARADVGADGPPEVGDNRVDRAAKRAGAGRRSARRPAVLLAHPLLSSSAEWVVAGPGKSLAFLLADEGYDVWLFNVRGNTYSLNHTTLSPWEPAFWDFSFHEHAMFDLPATIEYVVQATGQQKMQYVGFSMGTTIMFTMASLRPDFASRHISLFTALGPATALVHTRSRTFRLLAQATPALMRAAALVHTYRFLPASEALKAAGEIFCSDGSLTQPLCVGLIAALSGRNDAQTNRTLLPYIIARTPAGTSFKTINHFAQSMKKGFRQYDYGAAENHRRYGSETPPRYNMSNVFLPTRVHYGMNDQLADVRDVLPLCARLPGLLSCEPVADPLWTHLDFVWGKDAASLVYRKVMADMREAGGAAAWP